MQPREKTSAACGVEVGRMAPGLVNGLATSDQGDDGGAKQGDDGGAKAVGVMGGEGRSAGMVGEVSAGGWRALAGGKVGRSGKGMWRLKLRNERGGDEATGLLDTLPNLDEVGLWPLMDGLLEPGGVKGLKSDHLLSWPFSLHDATSTLILAVRSRLNSGAE